MSDTLAVSASHPVADAIHLASPWRRLGARVADLLTVLFLQWALTVISVFFFVPALVDRMRPEPWGRAFVPTVLFVVLLAVYETVFITRNDGRTPGKDLFHITVVVAGRGTTHPALRMATLRWLPVGAALMIDPPWVGVLAVFAFGVPVLAPSRRSLFDLVAGTQVVVDQTSEETSP